MDKTNFDMSSDDPRQPNLLLPSNRSSCIPPVIVPRADVQTKRLKQEHASPFPSGSAAAFLSPPPASAGSLESLRISNAIMIARQRRQQLETSLNRIVSLGGSMQLFPTTASRHIPSLDYTQTSPMVFESLGREKQDFALLSAKIELSILLQQQQRRADILQALSLPPGPIIPSTIPASLASRDVPVDDVARTSTSSRSDFSVTVSNRKAKDDERETFASIKTKRQYQDMSSDEEELLDQQEQKSTTTSGHSLQSQLWNHHFQALCLFRQKHGHCLVPQHNFKENPQLARWVKRQRYQYKLYQDGKLSSSMTAERIQALDSIEFVWDSHSAVWQERLQELKEYRREHSHCNVPTTYAENLRLASWVKCQRRQYKLRLESKPNNMTEERVQELEKIGFEWKLRSYRGMDVVRKEE